jgi:electron transfer flavoprotein beta subunit
VNVLVCVKRVPATGGRVVLTEDERSIDTRHLSFTISPHEECAAEAAVRLVEAAGGTATVLTLGPEAAADQLRDGLAMGIDRAVHLLTDHEEWDPQATALAIADAVERDRAAGLAHDLLLFGNEAADSGDFQVAVRVAEALGLPWLTGVQSLEIEDGRVRASRDGSGGREVFELPLPAVLAVREGLNRPRYPSIPGRLRARRIPIEAVQPEHRPGGLRMIRLRVAADDDRRAEVLGHGPEAAPAVVDVLVRMGLIVRAGPPEERAG